MSEIPRGHAISEPRGGGEWSELEVSGVETDDQSQFRRESSSVKDRRSRVKESSHRGLKQIRIEKKVDQERRQGVERVIRWEGS